MSANNTALEIQTKFAFYLVALVFTVLALGVETAKFDVSKLHNGIELSSWLFLLISGLSGLRRIEIIPRIISIGGTETNTKEGKKLKEDAVDSRQSSALIYYNIHIWTFVIGIILLVISRAYQGLSITLPC